jgi:hypothetical protein
MEGQGENNGSRIKLLPYGLLQVIPYGFVFDGIAVLREARIGSRQ